MPSYYDKPSVFGSAVVEDVARFNKLPFYLVKNEVKRYAKWKLFDMFYGKIDWTTNMGDIMKGVTPQGSPVGRSLFFPNAITTVANKDVFQVEEHAETGVVNAHKYESFQFNFLPSFDAFWDTYIKFANTDIVDQIGRSNEQFIETNMWFNAPYVYLAGTGLTSGNPTGMGNIALNAANSKTAAWLIAVTNGSNGNPGVQQNLRLRDVYRATMALAQDLNAPTFDGVRNMPKDNEGIKGKYCLVTSHEGWMDFTWDPDVATLKSINLDLLFDDFHGSLFNLTTVKIHRYPIRYNTVDVLDPNGTVVYKAGNPIPPEIYDVMDNKTKPNPYYTSLITAPFEINWLLGEDYAKTIKVGPPPKEFSTRNMSAEKFYSMRWNGEVRLTDQVLVTNSDGSVDLNNYGENLKFLSKLTHGYLNGETRNAFPILVKRARPAILSA